MGRVARWRWREEVSVWGHFGQNRGPRGERKRRGDDGRGSSSTMISHLLVSWFGLEGGGKGRELWSGGVWWAPHLKITAVIGEREPSGSLSSPYHFHAHLHPAIGASDPVVQAEQRPLHWLALEGLR